jgi:glycerol-3-phosphate dehydrogenase (NAD(P)+)
MANIAIIGAGSWGTALARVLTERGRAVALWAHDPELVKCLRAKRENELYMPGVKLPEAVSATGDLAEALEGAEFVVSAMPSHVARELYTRMLPHLPRRAILVSVTKGLETETFMRMSEVFREVAGKNSARPFAAVSGPSFAREVARGAPTAVVVASEDEPAARQVQANFSGPTFRLYRSTDVAGVELGGALKNVIAIAAGVVEGLGLGHNPLAALITRGLAEITRLACACGARRETMAGLAGLGDLVLTSTGDLSRNRQVGIELAKDRSLTEIVGSMRMVAEGVKTAHAAVALAARHGVEMPIAAQVDRILRGERSPRNAIRELMERPLKEE